jgi:hypothetical protein
MPYDAFISYCSEDKKKTIDQTVKIERPADGASLVGPLLLSWTTQDLPSENLSFEVSFAPEGAELGLTDVTPEIMPGIELEKMGFAVRKTDRALVQELNQRLAATAPGRDGVLSKSIPNWNQ